nr:hypothetical protein [Nitrosomonas nitrosa]
MVRLLDGGNYLGKLGVIGSSPAPLSRLLGNDALGGMIVVIANRKKYLYQMHGKSFG